MTSPLGLVPKPNSSKLRMIQDLSFPRNNPSLRSVNSFINPDDFPTAWGTFEETTKLILSLPDGCRAATFDISAAYRITPVRPSQQNFVCVLWRGKAYVDRAICFGLSSSAGIFGKVADMLVAIYKAAGFRLIIKWVDDFMVIALPTDTWTEEEFTDVTSPFGVPWAHAKTRRLAFVQRYIGFDWDLRARSVSLPEEKKAAVVKVMEDWLVPGARVSAHEAASLHGKLVHVSSIFKLIRPFLRSVAHFANGFLSHRARLEVPSPVARDLEWTKYVLLSSPNCLPLQPQAAIDLEWWGDASSSFGVGVVVGGHWAVWRYADGVCVGPGREYDIGWAEAVAVELGLLMALHEGLVSRESHGGRTLLVRSDNQGVVAVTNSGRSRSRNTNIVLKNIYRSLARSQLLLRTEYVRSRDNVVDALSRGDIPGFLGSFPLATSRSLLPLPAHLTKLLVPW